MVLYNQNSPPANQNFAILVNISQGHFNYKFMSNHNHNAEFK